MKFDGNNNYYMYCDNNMTNAYYYYEHNALSILVSRIHIPKGATNCIVIISDLNWTGR